MLLFDAIKNKFGWGKLSKKEQSEAKLLEEIDALGDEFISTSTPRNLYFGSSTNTSSITTNTRDGELWQRQAIYEDSFTREMVKVIIARAIGVTHDKVMPFQITFSRDAELNDNAKELLKSEVKYISKLINKSLFSVTMDSQFYGDGYVGIRKEDGKGVVGITHNPTTKSFYVTPIVTNFGRTLKYEISSNTKLYKSNTSKMDNSRTYRSPNSIARMNAQANGIMKLQSESVLAVENMNAFSDKETAYEDTIYGGVVEGCYENFERFRWAVNSLANMRISSAMYERFITVALEGTSEGERKLLKESLENKIKSIRDKVRERVTSKDSSVMGANIVIPTSNGNTNAVNIQESTPQFNQQIDDIMFHVKVYIADIGFDVNLTPFSDSMIGGSEQGGTTESSLQMDTQGEQIRGSIEQYIVDITAIHLESKFNININKDMLEVEFPSILNKAKMNSERQRMEAIQNTSSTVALMGDMKEQGFEDNEDDREMLKKLMADTVPATTNNKDEMLEAMVSHILKGKQKEEEE